MRSIQAVVAAGFAAFASLASASVFYKFDIVAQTGTGGIVSLGTGPSVNEKGKVAYIGRFGAAGTGSPSVLVWSPIVGSVDIAPMLSSSPNRTFGESARINKHDEVAAWTRVPLVLPNQLHEVRIFRSATPDDSTVMVRAASSFGQNYDLLYQNPALNATRVLEDRSKAGDDDGVCDAGETCASQVAFTTFIASPLQRHLATVVETPIAATDPGVQNQFGFLGQISKPAMADDGRIVIRANAPSNPILLFDHDLGSPAVTIAGSVEGFTATGVAPGITPDGKIVAFAGNRGQGDGVFLSQELPSGQRRIVRIAGENLTVQKPELGFSGTNSKLYFSSMELDSRVGIAYTRGADGASDSAVVVTFIGTPNAASRTNSGTGKPYVFSAQRGLWAMRLELNAPLYRGICHVRAPGVTGNPFTPGGDDQIQVAGGVPFVDAGSNGVCESGNSHDVETLFARAGPIPVVQVGDRILAHTVANVSVHDPVAPANFSDTGSARAAQLGDHRVAFWVDVGGGNQLIVRGEHLDSDQDGLMDHWETTGIDLEGTGFIDLDLAAMGATPFQRDLFVQIDWAADRAQPLNPIERHLPIPGVIRQLAQFFAAAPATPSGVPAGIRLHLDAGSGMDRAGQFFSRNMGIGPIRGGNVVQPQPIDILDYGVPGSITLAGANAPAMDTIKQNNLRNTHRGAREFAFSYIVLADFHHGLDQFGGSDNVTPVIGTATGSDLWNLYDSVNGNLQAGGFGHAILITGGTGAGQLRKIAASGVAAQGNFVRVLDAWTVLPDNTSTYLLLHGSGGLSHPDFRFDGAFSPGKDVAITLSGFGRDPVGREQGAFFTQWQTLAHELGHNQSLKHGGIDHVNYKANFVSLMNYAYQNCQTGVGTNASGNPLPGAAACPVNSFAGAADAVHDDWGSLEFASALNPRRTGQAFSEPPDLNTVPFPPPDSLRTLRDVLIQFGPQDTTAPVVAITSPVSGTAIAPGSGIAVTFTATDNVAVTRAEVLFDVNGNGEIDEPAEVFAATLAGGANFTANVPAVAGPSGTRSLTVYAFDQNGTPGTAYVRINVGSVAPLIVPNAVGALEQAARDALLAAGFEPGLVTSQQSAVAAGAVISQNPAAGQSRAPGTPVALVISLGPSGATVPNVTGLSQSQATAALAAAGFTAGAITLLNGSPLPANSVAGQSPAGGGIAPAGSAVELLVVAGAGISVPNVAGLTQAAATTAINNAGLVVGTITQQPSGSVPAGSVISQNPVSGTTAVAGSAVHLVVSIGASGVLVPNVVGLTQAAATTAITNAGLVVGTITQQTSPTVPAGNVISQNPPASTAVAAGSAVAIAVSLGPPCGGFVDIDPSSAFCPNVEWLRNRSVTLGCTSATLYCPVAGVSRLAMAAFMNRLGTSLSASTLVFEQSGLAFDPAVPQITCATGTFVATGFPRRGYVDGVARLLSNADTGIVVEPVASIDGGSTWTALTAQQQRGPARAGSWSNLRTIAHRDVDVSESIRFALRISRGGLAGSGTIVDGSCHLRVRIDNRNSSTAPFDPH